MAVHPSPLDSCDKEGEALTMDMSELTEKRF